MVLPDNINPKASLFYIGGEVLQPLLKEPMAPAPLFLKIKASDSDLSYQQFVLSLDWLFICGCVSKKEGTDLLYVSKRT
jgi:hypothetical protein